MDQYKISQNPSGNSNKKSASKRKGKATAKGPKSRQTQSLSPQMVLGGIVAALILVLGGIAWAHFVSKPASPATSANSGKVIGKGGNSTKVISDKTISAVTDAVGNKKPGDLQRYYAKNVCIVIIKSGVKKCVSASQVEALIGNPLNSAQTPWDWHVSPSQLSAWQTGPYGDYFQDGVLVGISSDGTVISIHFDDNGQIDTIFVAPVGDLTTPGNNSTDTGSNGSTGGGGDTTTDTTPPASGPAGGQNGSD